MAPSNDERAINGHVGPEEKLLRHLELVSEIESGLSWIPMDGLRLVDDKGI